MRGEDADASVVVVVVVGEFHDSSQLSEEIVNSQATEVGDHIQRVQLRQGDVCQTAEATRQ